MDGTADFLNRRRAALLLGCAVVLAFGLTLFNQFVDWDDAALILRNAIIQQPSVAHIRSAFTSYDPQLYVPLTTLSFQLEHLVHGNAAFPTHGLNLLLHLINVLLAWRFCAAVLRNEAAALLVALLYGVHPIQTEAVAWASARKDLLSGTFFFVALLAYMKGVERENSRWVAFASVTFLLGLLSKVTIAPLPLVLLLWEWRARGKLDTSSLRRSAAFLILALVFIAIAVGGKVEGVAASGFRQTALLIPYSVLFLLGKIIFPWHLAVLYPFTDPITLWNARIGLSIVGIIILLAAAICVGKRSRDAAFGLAFGLAMFIPSFGNFHRGEDFGDVYVTSDRSAYLVLLGILLALAPLVGRQPKISLRVGMVIAIAFIVLSARQTLYWHDTDALFLQTARVSPQSHIAQMNVGNSLFRAGNALDAIPYYERTLLVRDTGLASYNLGKALAAVGRYDDALAEYAKAAQLDPHLLDATLNIGVTMLRIGRSSEALNLFHNLAIAHPEFPSARYNEAVLLAGTGREDDAVSALEAVASQNPSFAPGALMLARLHAKDGRIAQAQAALERLLSVDPHNTEATELLHSLKQKP